MQLRMLDENGGCGKEKERNSCKSGESRGDMARGSSQKSAGISGKRRTRLRCSRRNWSFGDFCRHSCVRSSRSIYWKDFLPSVRPRRRESLEASGPAKIWYSRDRADLVRAPPSFRPPPFCKCTRLAALRALSSSLIEYSPLYLRMPVEIYRRSRCSFRFNLLRPALTLSVLSFPMFAYILRV